MAGIKEKLVIIGAGETAELAYEYFTRDTQYEVVGFSVEKEHINNIALFGLPVVPLENIEDYFIPHLHSAFVAVSYTQLNRLRSRLFNIVKNKGYHLCSYISPKANISSNIEIGENCFIFENVTLQRGSKIEDCVTIWTGSTIGHRTHIGNNCFLAMHVAISGFCDVGDYCFFGVNSCMSNNLRVTADCIIGAGAVLIKDATEGGIYVGNPAKPLPNKITNTNKDKRSKMSILELPMSANAA
jgi:sugar O-acyltransferase (sialic acid O-acetyltransferase NeuD family)